MKKKLFLLTNIIVVLFAIQPLAFAKSSKKSKSTSSPQSHLLKDIEQKTEYLKRKIEETRAKEKVAIGKLTQIQSRLYNTQQELRKNKSKLTSAQNDLNNTENKLVELKQDYSQLRQDSAGRIRQIYQGQRLRMFELLLSTPNLTDFLDILYYQKLLVSQDKQLLDRLEEQSKLIENQKEQLAEQKIKFASIVSQVEKQKREIVKEHVQQSSLVRKLRTERGTYEQAERQLERESQQLIADINRLVGKDSFSGEGSLPGTGLFAYPLRGRLTSPFGYRKHPMFRVVSFHSGVDLAAPYGTPIMASDSGRVIFTGWYGGYGKVVIVDHGMDFSTLYAHLRSSSVSKGRSVSQGQVIGYEGQTGYSTGPHLHFEVRKSGKPQNPLNYLR